MERKIGEIFEFGGEWYQCVFSMRGCRGCDFRTHEQCTHSECMSNKRSDGISVIFKKLEKVGEPYEYFMQGIGIIMVQEYILANANYIWEYSQDIVVMDCQNGKVAIEIKQTKKDMEDLDKIKVRDYTKVEELNVMEEKKLNLKPFDIQKAREGKPVCTRNGKKARIICFNRRLFYNNVSYPILALVERSDGEDDVCGYNEKGEVLIEDGAAYKDNLMMLPEKKEGWVNVYKDSVYDTKDKALIGRSESRGYIDTIKINWSE